MLSSHDPVSRTQIAWKHFTLWEAWIRADVFLFFVRTSKEPHFTSGTNESRSMQIHTRVRTHTAVTHTQAHMHMAKEKCQAITRALSLWDVLQCALSHSAVSFFKC